MCSHFGLGADVAHYVGVDSGVVHFGELAMRSPFRRTDERALRGRLATALADRAFAFLTTEGRLPINLSRPLPPRSRNPDSK